MSPNPNNVEFTLFANLSEDSPLSISLYNVMRSRKIPIDFSKYKTTASCAQRGRTFLAAVYEISH